MFKWIGLLIGLWVMLIAQLCLADTASWYSYESCKKEGTSGIMANGEVMKNENFTCASWDYPFGTRLKVSEVGSGRSVICEVTDRGPSKRLYKKGRKIDLSASAFKALAGKQGLNKGILKVKIERI